MKLLLLSCPTGEGHNSARRALAEELQRQGVEYVLADPVGFQSKRARELVASAYNGLIRRAPAAFGMIYRIGAVYESTGLRSPVYYANAHYASTLHDYLQAEQFDGVLSTHLFGLEAVTAIRRRTGAHIPSFGVLTDYTCIPFFAEVDADLYFVPHEQVAAELARKGIPSDRIVASGIPVSRRFRVPVEPEKARMTLGLPLDRKIYLLLTGGVGCGHVCVLCEELLKRIGEDGFLCVLTGRNDALCEQLTERFGSFPFRAVPFTGDVPLFLRAADAVISKPGGLAATEAAVSNVPLVHFGAIPGCETRNAAFFADHGMSLWAKNGQEAVSCAVELAHDPVRAEQIRQKQRETLSPVAAETVVTRIREQLGKEGAPCPTV